MLRLSHGGSGDRKEESMELRTEATYALIAAPIQNGGLAFRTINVEGERALCLFESAGKVDARDAAEAHAMLTERGANWQVVEGLMDDLAPVLEEAADHIEYLTLNPPVAYENGPTEGVRLISIRRFMEV